MVNKPLLFYLTVFPFVSFAAVNTNLINAAEYYYTKQDYRQSAQLWTEVIKKNPEDINAVIKLAELKLLLEGMAQSYDVLQTALENYSSKVDSYKKNLLVRKITKTLETFGSEEAQSFYLQARPKVNFNDCPGALVLLKQSLSIEPLNLLSLREKAKCERKTGDIEAYFKTVQSIYSLNPNDPVLLSENVRSLFSIKKYPEITSIDQWKIMYVDDFAIKSIYIYSLIENQMFAQAIILLEDLFKAQGKKTPNVFHFLKAKVLSKLRNTTEDELAELSQFIDNINKENAQNILPGIELRTLEEETKKRIIKLTLQLDSKTRLKKMKNAG